MRGYKWRLTMKRFVCGTSVFVCVWVTCVTVFLLQMIGSTPKDALFYLTHRNVTRASTSVRALHRNTPIHTSIKTSPIMSLNNGDNIDNKVSINKSFRQTPKVANPDRWNKWKQNVDLHLDSESSLKQLPSVRVIQKSIHLAETGLLNYSTHDLGKLPGQNDSLSIIFMKRKAAENRYYSLKKTKVNLVDQEFLITGAQLCDAAAPFLLIIIPSIPSHFSVRNVIRKTYGTYAEIKINALKKPNDALSETVKVMFFVGKGENKSTDEQIKAESRRHGDIVQADFQESYYNLTLKILLALRWTAFYCSEIDYMLKIDEDTFFNLPLLIQKLKKRPYDMKGTIYGHINYQSSVRRAGKWQVGWKEFPLLYYPTYASGNSYVISGNIVPRLFMVSEYYPYMPIEDAFVTGVLARVIGAKHVDLRGFTYWGDSAPEPCAFVRESRISATKVTESLMGQLWDAMADFDKYCRYNLKAVMK